MEVLQLFLFVWDAEELHRAYVPGLNFDELKGCSRDDGD